MVKERNARGKFFILQIINIFQPIERIKLRQILGEVYEDRLINKVIKKLVEEQRVVEESKKLRVTRYGLETVVPGETRILRDKYRMHYLYEKWKKGGEAF